MKDVVLLENSVLKYRPDSSVPVSTQAVAERISSILGGKLLEGGDAYESAYYVPFAAVHAELAQQRSIQGTSDVYGGVVQDLHHADKAVLHQLLSPDVQHPPWYLQKFAKTIGEVVLPGFTVFTRDDATDAFDTLQDEGHSVRLKDPSNTGGLGQQSVGSHAELMQVLSGHGDKLTEVGAVLEADVKDPRTVTAGYVNLDGQMYSWHGQPYDVEHNGINRFGGNTLTVVKGDFRDLQKYCSTPKDRLALAQAARVLDVYDILNARIARATFDVVQGVSNNGEPLSGVTDPSLRPSASSAAEVRAIEAFSEQPDAEVITTDLAYDYTRRSTPNDASSWETFIAHKHVNILVRLVDTSPTPTQHNSNYATAEVTRL